MSIRMAASAPQLVHGIAEPRGARIVLGDGGVAWLMGDSEWAFGRKNASWRTMLSGGSAEGTILNHARDHRDVRGGRSIFSERGYFAANGLVQGLDGVSTSMRPLMLETFCRNEVLNRDGLAGAFNGVPQLGSRGCAH